MDFEGLKIKYMYVTKLEYFVTDYQNILAITQKLFNMSKPNLFYIFIYHVTMFCPVLMFFRFIFHIFM